VLSCDLSCPVLTPVSCPDSCALSCCRRIFRSCSRLSCPCPVVRRPPGRTASPGSDGQRACHRLCPPPTARQARPSHRPSHRPLIESSDLSHTRALSCRCPSQLSISMSLLVGTHYPYCTHTPLTYSSVARAGDSAVTWTRGPYLLPATLVAIGTLPVAAFYYIRWVLPLSPSTTVTRLGLSPRQHQPSLFPSCLDSGNHKDRAVRF